LIATVPDVYYVKGHVNIFFYSSFWYCYSYNGWYVSSSYNGPWTAIDAAQLPVRFGQIPPGHLRTPPGRDKNPPPGYKDRDKDDDEDGPP